MKHSIGNTITLLRKNKKWSQDKLADELGISKTIISNWEEEKALPDILIISKVANVLGVTVDYIVSGSTPITMVQKPTFETIAKDDSLEQYFRLKGEIGNSFYFQDSCRLGLIDYIVKYQSTLVFAQFFKDLGGEIYIANKDLPYTNNYYILMMKLLANIADISYLKTCTHKDIDKKIVSPSDSSIAILDDYIFEIILFDERINDGIRERILSADNDFWNLGYPYLIDIAYSKKDLKTFDRLVTCIEKANEIIVEKLQYKGDIQYDDRVYRMSRGLTIENRQYKKIKWSFILEKTIRSALSNSDYKLVERLNKINQTILNIRPGLKLYVASEYEIKMQKVSDNPKMSKKDKLRESVIHDGYLNVDELIAIGDYDLYEELIGVPTSQYEKLLNMINNKEYDKILDFSIENNLTFITYLHKKGDFETINRIIIGSNSLENIKKLNYTRMIPNRMQVQKNNLINNKYVVPFKSIIKHEDKRFFMKAIETDPKNLDWALENIEPSRFDIIKLLLDSGARLHKRWLESDDEGYRIDRDELDLIGTEILKKKVNDVLGCK